MITKDKTLKRNVLLFLLIFIILIGITIGNNLRNKEEKKAEEPNLTIETESNIFKIDSVLLYSSANAENHSESQTEWNLSVYQYTDIAIKIDNMVSMDKLTNKNTIKELYIDNFSFPSKPDLGNPSFYYKNPTKFGVANINDEYKIKNSLKYHIINSNENIDYSKPIFYTDCSNPITISYVNKNVAPNLILKNNKETNITFDGTLLRDSSTLLSKISSTISFKIHIINYLDEEFTCEVTLDIPLQDDINNIYQGSYQKELTTLKTRKFYKIEKQ
ncbi:MAG: hypothetical protein IKF52_07145 [Clostridia bacterium]|nr:hypothetical protein [Clostridia bacterium]